jgi:hypothetical protein
VYTVKKREKEAPRLDIEKPRAGLGPGRLAGAGQLTNHDEHMTNSQKRQIVRQSAESLLDRIHEARQIASPLSGRQKAALKPVVQAIGRLTRTYRGTARHSLSAYRLRLSKLQARARFILKGFTAEAEAEAGAETEAEAGAPEPANAGRYARANATVRLSGGLPVALRRVVTTQGSGARQLVTPAGVEETALGPGAFRASTAPLN